MKEFFYEIIASIKENKLRTALTGFSVAWGIFILIILLGVGNGFRQGVESSSISSDNINVIQVYAGYTELPYGGNSAGRQVQIKDNNLESLRLNIPQIVSYGVSDSYLANTTTLDGDMLRTTIKGINITQQEISDITIISGRLLNSVDVEHNRKFVTVNEYVANNLFGSNDKAINSTIFIDGIGFTIVGITKGEYAYEVAQVCIPISTLYDINTKLKDDGYYSISLRLEGVNDSEESKEINSIITTILARELQFSINDNGAIWLQSNIDQYLEFRMIFTIISTLLWVIGLGILMIGVIGVSNIMIVSVNERITEFGIRKSMGATPLSLVKIIFAESIMLTSAFGYIGLFLGVVSLKILDYYLDNGLLEKGVPEQIDVHSIFVNPTIDIKIALGATVVLIVGGLIAGYIPARRAVRLKTIDAMRYNR